jgi:LacI family transcriptional regulator, repressor for deo operon, udp, cdd, tsx, nupC, and nupG
MPAGQRPTALFAANDEMAIGCLKRFAAEGVSVPERFSIIGFDGIEYADYSLPTLTTVRQPRWEIGHCAGATLMSILRGGASDVPRRTVLAATLEARGSTARVAEA